MVLTGSALLFLATLVILAGCGGPAPPRLQLEITSPTTRVETTAPELTVTGIISDSTAVIKVNGITTTVESDGAFTQTIPLPYGATRVSITAEKAGVNTVTRTINVTRNLVLTVTTPDAESQAEGNQVTVSGMISDLAARVFVTGKEVEVGTDGSFSTVVALHYMETVIKVSALLEGTDPLATLLTVTRVN